MQTHVLRDVTLRGWPLASPGMPSARPAKGTFWHWIHRCFAVAGRITAYGCHTCHQYVCAGCRAPDRPPARCIGRPQSISTRHKMTCLQCIQASSWSHAHVTPDVVLAWVYLASCEIAYDTPPGDACCVCQFSIELCRPGADLPCSSPTSSVPCSHGCSLSTTVATYEAV